jgi:CheY-like chemotaxis protein
MEHDDVQEPSRRVLIVDDEPTIRAALRRFFTKRGWEVDDAADGPEALARLSAPTPPYHLVVSDVRMPNMSGMELYRHAVEARPALHRRFIFSSGDAEAPGLAEFAAASGCAILHKPFTLEALGRAVEKLQG